MLHALSNQTRVAFCVALVLSIAGAVAWFDMPREEDPRIKERFGIILAEFPGADVANVERLIAKPIEDQLAEVAQVSKVRTSIRPGIAMVDVTLMSDVTDTDNAWQDVRVALDLAHRAFPDQARAPALEHKLMDTEAVLLALTGNLTELELADQARQLKKSLLGVNGVSRVHLSGAAEPRVMVELEDAQAYRLMLAPEQLAVTLAQRNVTSPGGGIQVAGQAIALRPVAEFGTLEEIRETPVTLGSGAVVPLGEIANVTRTIEAPRAELARLNGQQTVVVGVVPRSPINTTEFGSNVRAAVREFGERNPHVQLTEIAFQPDQVEGRLSDLGRSLLSGVGIVALVLVMAMGIRLGLVVSAIVPLATLSSVALYAMFGGILHQIAVAAFVLSLGLLVDNAIVVAESIQRKLDSGISRSEAAKQTIRELALPLASATGTTVAAFVPMLLAEGATGDFTRAVPSAVMITLLVSLAYALLVTGPLASRLLEPRPIARIGWTERLAGVTARVSTRSPVLTLAATACVLAGCMAFAPWVSTNFFPASDRSQLVVSIELPPGTHFEETNGVADELERKILALDEVIAVTGFVGRAAPFFYYNLPRAPNSPHLASLIVSTSSLDVSPLQARIDRMGLELAPAARVLARKLEQGPPVLAPVQVRLFSEDLESLHEAALQVRSQVRAIPGTYAVTSTEGAGVASLKLDIYDAAAQRVGLDRGAVAQALFGRTRGLAVGQFRAGDEPEPIVVRSALGERLSQAQLMAIPAAATHPLLGGHLATPLDHVTRTTLEYQPAVVHHHNRQRTASVIAEVADGFTHEDVVRALTPVLDQSVLPAGVRWELGGSHESSSEANAALAEKAPFGLGLLLLIILLEFNSLRRVAIVVATAPLAIIGIWPGLYLAGVSFGFVAQLGAIALVGLVINAALVILDVTERQRELGSDIATALEYAVRLRLRPILLTVGTTVAGLAPLLFSQSTLWPPLAAAMMSGLTIGTALSIVVVPAMYRLLFRDEAVRSSPGTAIALPVAT